MKKYEKVYQQLKQQYSDEEIVDAVFIPEDLSLDEKEELDTKMKEIRFKKLREISEKESILSDVMRLRFQIENYLDQDSFSFEKTFGKFLEEYLRVTKKSRKEIASELVLHYTKLSRIINDKEEPNIELCYRLEKHSGNLIKASIWWKLIAKKQEFIITKDEETRRVEQEKVKITIRA